MHGTCGRCLWAGLGGDSRNALIDFLHDLVTQVGSLVERRLGVANLCLLQLLHLLLDLRWK